MPAAALSTVARSGQCRRIQHRGEVVTTMDMGGPNTGEDRGEGGERTVGPGEHDNPGMLTPTVEKLVKK